MKVKIGKYINWIGPYQLVDMLFFWLEKYPEKELAKRWDYRLHDRMGTWLASTWVAKFCEWVHSKRKRTEKIHIDPYDVWGMDHTLSLIVVPMLKQLKKVKHGAPHVDPEDVPKHLRPTPKQIEKYSKMGDTDPKFFKRWDWVMDEMIWAHEQLLDEDSDEKFWIEHGEIDWGAGTPDEKGLTPVVWKKKAKVDWKGYRAHHARIDNGLRLFGKYYRNLWD